MLQEMEVIVTRAEGEEPRVPSWAGGKFPLSTFLADRVRRILSTPKEWRALPGPVTEWLEIQTARSVLPRPGELLVETFPRGAKHYLVCYPFDGRLAHQTLGMLLTRRLERAGKQPLGFVASEYALAVWGLKALDDVDLAGLFDEDMLGDDLDEWLAESALLKRTFRQCAVIAGLIERRFPGKEKTGRQVTFSSDLIYDVLREHEPGHILLEATWSDAAKGLLDIARLAALLKRIRGRIVHQSLPRVSPLAVPVMLEIGKEPVYGAAGDALLGEVADELIAEAIRLE
jgi:ATP-dependent Lhr-like helicase